MSASAAPTPPPRPPPPAVAFRSIHQIGEALVEGPPAGPLAPPNLMLLRPELTAPTHVKLAGSHFVPATQPPPGHIADPGVVPVADIFGRLTQAPQSPAPPAPAASPSVSVPPPPPPPPPLSQAQIQARADQAIVNTGISPKASNTLMLSDAALHKLSELVARGKLMPWQKISLLHALYNDKTGAYGQDCSAGALDTKVQRLLEDIDARGFRTAMSDTAKDGLSGFDNRDAAANDLSQAMQRAGEVRGAFYNSMISLCRNPNAHQALLPLVKEMKRRYDAVADDISHRTPFVQNQLQALYEMEAADHQKLMAYLEADQKAFAIAHAAPGGGGPAPQQLTPAQEAMVQFLEALRTQGALVPQPPAPGQPPPPPQVNPDAMARLQAAFLAQPVPVPPTGAPAPSPATPPATMENPAVFEIFKPDNHYGRTLVAASAPSVATAAPSPAAAGALPPPSPLGPSSAAGTGVTGGSGRTA